MVALLKSDMFRNFMGGFILATIGILTLQPAGAQREPDSTAVVSSDNSVPDGSL